MPNPKKKSGNEVMGEFKSCGSRENGSFESSSSLQTPDIGISMYKHTVYIPLIRDRYGSLNIF